MFNFLPLITRVRKVFGLQQNEMPDRNKPDRQSRFNCKMESKNY